MSSCPLKNGCSENWTWEKEHKRPLPSMSCTDYITAALNHATMHLLALRGTKVLNSDAHYWEVQVNRIDDDVPGMLIGVVRGKPLNPNIELESHNDQNDGRWGLKSTGCLSPMSLASGPRTYTQAFPKQTVLGVMLDRTQGTLSYYQDGIPLGVAFTIPNYLDYELFPAVWNITPGTEVNLGKQLRSFYNDKNLQDRCRATIIELISKKTDIDLLNLPTAIKDYLCDGYYEQLVMLSEKDS